MIEVTAHDKKELKSNWFLVKEISDSTSERLLTVVEAPDLLGNPFGRVYKFTLWEKNATINDTDRESHLYRNALQSLFHAVIFNPTNRQNLINRIAKVKNIQIQWNQKLPQAWDIDTWLKKLGEYFHIESEEIKDILVQIYMNIKRWNDLVPLIPDQLKDYSPIWYLDQSAILHYDDENDFSPHYWFLTLPSYRWQWIFTTLRNLQETIGSQLQTVFSTLPEQIDLLEKKGYTKTLILDEWYRPVYQLNLWTND